MPGEVKPLKSKVMQWHLTSRRHFFSLASHAPSACEARALRARKTLAPRFTDFFTDFEKKTDCFAVYLTSDFPQIKGKCVQWSLL